MITTTHTLTQDTDLVGDVTCTVSGNPCLAFGAPGIQLRLHGHTITGQGSPDRCPSGVFFGEVGIHTKKQAGVSIVGPGLVRRFREHGIMVNSDHSAVRQVVVASSCLTGIVVFGRENRVEQTTVVRAALMGPGFAGIFCSGDGGHRLRHNEVVSGGGPGITVVPSSGSASLPNLLEENSASGNDGIGILLALGAIGNTVRRNAVLGNRQSPGYTGWQPDWREPVRGQPVRNVVGWRAALPQPPGDLGACGPHGDRCGVVSCG